MAKVTEISPCVGQYIRDIAKSTPLSGEEEAELARRIKMGDQSARDKLVEANLRFVGSVAVQYLGHGLPVADLISAGNIGLIIAAERFDEFKKVKFVSYAVWWIRQAILKAIAEEGRTVRLPDNRVKAVVKLNKAKRALFGSLGRSADNNELAQEIGWTAEEVADINRISAWEYSLDSPIGYDGKMVVMDIMPDTRSGSADEHLAEKEAREKLDEALGSLDSRSRDVVELWFGLKNLDVIKSPKQRKDRNTLEQIGQHFGLTRERVRQIKKTALPELKKVLLRNGISSSRLTA